MKQRNICILSHKEASKEQKQWTKNTSPDKIRTNPIKRSRSSQERDQAAVEDHLKQERASIDQVKESYDPLMQKSSP